MGGHTLKEEYYCWIEGTGPGEVGSEVEAEGLCHEQPDMAPEGSSVEECSCYLE